MHVYIAKCGSCIGGRASVKIVFTVFFGEAASRVGVQLALFYFETEWRQVLIAESVSFFGKFRRARIISRLFKKRKTDTCFPGKKC